jgi:mono/diheme cytochrome c family protein
LGDGAGGGPGGVAYDAGPVAADLPCDVALVLSTDCAECHGPTSTQGLVRLASRADLLATSPVDGTHTEAQLAVIRMQQAVGEMPPAPRPAATAAKVAAFTSWIALGLPAGACGVTAGDGGTYPASDAGVWDGGVLAGLPCDVAAMVAAKCVGCHAPGGPNVPLLSLANFLAPAPSNAALTVAQAAAQRLASTTRPMPPLGSPAASPAEVAAFNAWLGAGTPSGSCGAVDAGLGDGGLYPTTCASGVSWTRGNRESPDMNPGRPCYACHLQSDADKRYTFSGTVFPALHEADLCDAPSSGGVTVQILDANKLVVATLTPSGVSGNFYSDPGMVVALPYTARVWRGSVYAEMTTPQMSGDCNSCHSEQGANLASGRILAP